jgi:hypothetical protein
MRHYLRLLAQYRALLCRDAICFSVIRHTSACAWCRQAGMVSCPKHRFSSSTLHFFGDSQDLFCGRFQVCNACGDVIMMTFCGMKWDPKDDYRSDVELFLFAGCLSTIFYSEYSWTLPSVGLWSLNVDLSYLMNSILNIHVRQYHL